MSCHLAVDIGASSGRLMAFSVVDNKLEQKEIHRFDNGLTERNGHLCWNIHFLFDEILVGIKKSVALNLNPTSIGIDTWAVDFVLLDEADQLVTDTISYRDHRTDGMMAEAFKIMDEQKIYARTGIQFQKFNTLFQLLALKKEQPEALTKARKFLMIPDYLNFLLTGVKKVEYTNATTTQLVNAETRTWDEEILKSFGINAELFPEIIEPATILGSLKPQLVQQLDVDLQVIAPATHDTASAIVSVPCHEEKTIYISSGTWSLMGVENDFPLITEDTRKYNFTNEGSMNNRFRFLKNIMGMWIIQEIRREYKAQHSFSELVEHAKRHANFPSIINVNDERFLSPANMLQEIQDYCAETKQQIPQEIGEYTSCVYNSLAHSYAETVLEIEALKGETYDMIYIIGGGSKNHYLNQLLADRTNKRVYAGLEEATAIGNALAQLIAMNKLANVEEARNLVNATFEKELFLKQ